MSNSISGINNKKVIITDDGRQYKKPSVADNGFAAFTANAAGGAAIGLTRPFFQAPFIKGINKITQAENDVYKNIIDPVMQNSGLLQKGVTIEQSTIQGDKTAFFSPLSKKISINKDKMAFATFHEMGHALNLSSAVNKIVRSLRKPGNTLSGLVLLTACFKRKKIEGEKPKGPIDKITTFVKEHAGLLAFAGMVPTLYEEASASIKGSKLAKGFLSANNYKKLNILNGKAFLTYLGTAVGLGLAAFSASKIHDMVMKPKEIKNNGGLAEATKENTHKVKKEKKAKIKEKQATESIQNTPEDIILENVII